MVSFIYTLDISVILKGFDYEEKIIMHIDSTVHVVFHESGDGIRLNCQFIF